MNMTPSPPSGTQEKRPLVVHLHWASLARDLGILVAGLLLPPIIMGVLLSSLLSDGVVAFIGHLVPLLSALWALVLWMTGAILWTRYYLSAWIVTDEYLIHVNQVNLFVREVAGWDMRTVREAEVQADEPLGPMFDYGSIRVKLAGNSTESEYIMADMIPHPGDMCSAIVNRMPKTETTGGTSQAQETLLRSISHEMKGHLTRSQATFASIIQGDFGPVPENLKNVAGAALADTREGVETVMNILNSSNFKKGTLSFDKEQFDLLATIRESIDELRTDAARKGVLLRFKPKDLTCFIEGDREKLKHHVFRNLIDNSIRYTPAGTIDINLTSDDGFALFSIIDTGVGISREDMQHLFTEGGKGAESTKVNPASTGYGLFVAKMIVEGHGGQIWAESDGIGAGSRFFVKIPIRPTYNTAHNTDV